MKGSDGPIVDAVREAREKIFAGCGYDMGRLAERLRKIEAEHKGPFRSPRKERLKVVEARDRHRSSSGSPGS